MQNTVLINVSQNIPLTPEIIAAIQLQISSKYGVNAAVMPNPVVSKPIQVSSDDLDETVINQIEADVIIIVFDNLNQQQNG